jgi:RNA polymerase sigma factor (sigma-70 family)
VLCSHKDNFFGVYFYFIKKKLPPFLNTASYYQTNSIMHKSENFWEITYQQQAPKLLAVCRRYVQDIYKAEDLMHDAFLTAIKKQEYFSGSGAFEGWLHRITVNTVLMYLRNEKKLTQLLDETAISQIETEYEINEETPKRIIQSVDFEQADLLSAIDLLPEHHRVVFNLYVFEEYTHKQIGEMLNISPGTSKSHLARARKKIQAILLKKAIEMKEKKKRAAFIPLMNEPDKYVDNLFKKQLRGHEIQPKQMPDFLKTAIQTTPNSPIKPSNWWTIQKTWVKGSGLFTVAALLSFLFFKNSKTDLTQQNTLSDAPKTEQSTPNLTAIPPIQETCNASNEVAVNTPTFPIELKKEPKPTEKPIIAAPILQKKKNAKPETAVTQNIKQEEKQPVVIKRKVIVKDTVFKTIDH